MCRLDILSHRRLIQTRGHVLHWIQLGANAPNHKIRAGAESYSRVAVDQECLPKIIDGRDEASLAISLLVFLQQAPVRKRAIESKIDELTREFAFVLLEFLNVRSEPQRSSGRIIILILLDAHNNFRSERSYGTSNSLREIDNAHLFCLVSGPLATGGGLLIAVVYSPGFSNCRGLQRRLSMTKGYVIALSATVCFLFITACKTETTTNTKPNTNGAATTQSTPDQFAAVRSIYEKNCKECHGQDGQGGRVTLKDGTKLKVPSLREGHALHHKDAEFVKQI